MRNTTTIRPTAFVYRRHDRCLYNITKNRSEWYVVNNRSRKLSINWTTLEYYPQRRTFLTEKCAQQARRSAIVNTTRTAKKRSMTPEPNAIKTTRNNIITEKPGFVDTDTRERDFILLNYLFFCEKLIL